MPRLPTLAAALALLATSALGQDAGAYVAVPGDGPVWGLALDTAARDGPYVRLSYVEIDGEDPSVAEIRGDLVVDCAADRSRLLESRTYAPGGEVIGLDPPEAAWSGLIGDVGQAIRESVCEGKPAAGRRYDLPALHELAERQLR